ncbi:hypothetical protein [Aurantiacibacter sediminis]|uniref:Uncharacterized protein n=1 Tax=Aurantiacibacter sediminis TaxID=2793064 RepID=A0ABS0N5A2_9SPHN|nr:hypothetical protein [Aurantiacibacter sediminis]MBH5322964.1 hypothetical protein [Aurantiacibacter sediminis]
MEFDFLHAAIAAVLIAVAVFLIRRNDEPGAHRKWDWRIFFATLVIVAVLNIIWPNLP